MLWATKKGPTTTKVPCFKKALIKYHFLRILSNMRC